MLAHRLRHRITFQRKAEAVRDEGGYVIDPGGWVTVVLDDGTVLEDVPAEVLTGPGREFIGSDAKQAETSARINLRWFPAAERLMAQWRVLWDGRIYNITSVDADATARREWRLRCIDGPSEGG